MFVDEILVIIQGESYSSSTVEALQHRLQRSKLSVHIVGWSVLACISIEEEIIWKCIVWEQVNLEVW